MLTAILFVSIFHVVKGFIMLSVVELTCHPSSQEAEAGGLTPKPRMHSEILSQNKEEVLLLYLQQGYLRTVQTAPQVKVHSLSLTIREL